MSPAEFERLMVVLERVAKALEAAPAKMPPAASVGPVFPPYGKSKGAPVAGAAERDLRFYGQGAIRSLADPSKARFHPKEKELLDAIRAELDRRGLAIVEEAEQPPDPPADDFGPPPPF